MHSHNLGFSFVGVAVVIAAALAGGVFAVTTSPFSLSESQQPAATSSANSTSSNEVTATTTDPAASANSTIFIRFSVGNAIEEPVEGNTISVRYQITFTGEYKLYKEVYLSGRGNQMETNEELVATGTISQSRLQELKDTLSDARFYSFPSSVPQSDGRLQFEGPSRSITIKARSKPGERFHAVRDNEGARGGTYPSGYVQIKEKLSNQLEDFQSFAKQTTDDESWKSKLDSRLIRLVEDGMNSPLEPDRVNDSGEDVYGVFIETDQQLVPNQTQKLRDIGIDLNSVSGGDIVTTRVTENEIIRAAKLEFVSRIDSGGQLETTNSGGQLEPL